MKLIGHNGKVLVSSGNKAYKSLAEKVIEPLSVTENGTYTAPSGVDGYSPVEVNVGGTVIEPLNVTENGVYTAPSGKAYTPVKVAVGEWQRPAGWPDLDAIYQGMGKPNDTLLYTVDTTLPYPHMSIYVEVSSGQFKCQVWDYSNPASPVQIGTDILTNNKGTALITDFGICTYPVVKVIPATVGETFKNVRFTAATVGGVSVDYNGNTIVEVKGHQSLETGGITYSTQRFFSKYVQRISVNYTKKTRMFYAYADCNSLVSLDMSEWNTSGWETDSLQNAFSGCSSIKKLDLRSWDVSNWVVTSINAMFNGCTSLEEINCNGWDTSGWAVTNCQSFIRLCFNLRKIDFGGWDTTGWTFGTNWSQYWNTSTRFPDHIDFGGIPFPYTGWISTPYAVDAVFTSETPITASTTLNYKLFSHETLLGFIANLQQTTSALTLTIGQENLSRLTSAEIAVATGKGWTLA